MELLTVLAGVCGSCATIAGFLGVAWRRVKPAVDGMARLAEVPEQLDAVKADVQALHETATLSKEAHLSSIRDRLKQSGTHYLAAGSITMDELEVFNKLFDTYTKLGGNGSIKTLHEQVNRLPIRTE